MRKRWRCNSGACLPRRATVAKRPADSFARAKGARAGVPHVCLRIPTGGGKTVLGAHAVARLAGTLGSQQLWGQRPVVLWLTPTDMIRRQTLHALQQPDHPYALALAGHFGADVTVLELEQFATLSPEDWGHKGGDSGGHHPDVPNQQHATAAGLQL